MITADGNISDLVDALVDVREDFSLLFFFCMFEIHLHIKGNYKNLQMEIELLRSGD